MTQPKMTRVSIDALSPNPWNTNKINDPANEEKLRESLRRFGVFKPVIVREFEGGLQILGGEHRWRGAKQLGHKDIPIVNLGPIDDKRAKEIGLVDNGRYGEDDLLSLSGLLRELGNDVHSFMPLADIDLQGVLDASKLDMDDLDSVDRSDLPNLQDVKPLPTAQVMRFKVPVEDVAWASEMIEREMKTEGFKDEDSLTNAGHALISLLKKLQKAS